MKLSDWFNFGYGPVEFHRDLHAAVFAGAAWASIRIPEIKEFTAEQFIGDLKVIGCLMLAKFLASYVLNSKPPDSQS
jgi:hypothetical protein